MILPLFVPLRLRLCVGEINSDLMTNPTAMWAKAIVSRYYKPWIVKGLPCPIETHCGQRQITEERWNTMCVCGVGGVGGGGTCGYWKGCKWPTKFFHHVPLSSSSFYSLTTFAPFPTHCQMVIYLVGKGSAFSPARSTTAAAMAEKKKRRSRAAPRKRSGRKWEKGTENISLVSVSPATPTLPPTLPHRCNGSGGLATDSEGRVERITCQYLFPAAAWIETDTLHSLSLVSPPKPIQELYLCLGSRGLQGVAWEKADSDGGHRGKGLRLEQRGWADD